jgi:hypothetical protein
MCPRQSSHYNRADAIGRRLPHTRAARGQDTLSTSEERPRPSRGGKLATLAQCRTRAPPRCARLPPRASRRAQQRRVGSGDTHPKPIFGLLVDHHVVTHRRCSGEALGAMTDSNVGAAWRILAYSRSSRRKLMRPPEGDALEHLRSVARSGSDCRETSRVGASVILGRLSGASGPVSPQGASLARQSITAARTCPGAMRAARISAAYSAADCRAASVNRRLRSVSS